MEGKAAQQNKNLSDELKQGLGTCTAQVNKAGGGTPNFPSLVKTKLCTIRQISSKINMRTLIDSIVIIELSNNLINFRCEYFDTSLYHLKYFITV